MLYYGETDEIRESWLNQHAVYFRQAIESQGGEPHWGRHFTLGTLRDWLVACGMSDDDDVSFSEEGLALEYEVPGVYGGPANVVYTCLEYTGACHTQVGGRYTSPSVLGPHVSPERMQEWLMSRVTKPWEPADDKPEEPGWTIQPEVESREGKGDVSTHDER